MKKGKWVVVGAVACMLAQMSFGGVIIGEGSNYGGFGDWNGAAWAPGVNPHVPGGEFGTVLENQVIGTHNSALQITATGVGGSPEDAIFDASAGDIYNGNWLGGMGGEHDGVVRQVSFDFYGMANMTGLDFYFSDGLSEWHYGIDNIAVGWKTYTVSMTYSGLWFDTLGGGTPTDFSDALGSVSDVGIVLGYSSDIGPQLYGLDNFTLDDAFVVPEPETYALLGFAILSVGLTFRKKLDESLALVITQLKG